ncbi:MAG: carbamoyl phosphate synthase small subunit [Chitinispirillales bacterium]|jgi:carbamoyl-phosphate synthase small subunit|nr:carbamoyl phosphate synthase small subunit [Chitinispirillales bacterium]
MLNTAYLILENGLVFEGKFFGKQGEVIGEIVFTTGMTGYLETLTDPSYYGQIVLQTFPLIGNYGVIPPDFESAGVHARAYIVKHPCRHPSNFRSEGSLDEFLRERGVIGIYGIDTRALTKIIRENGVMNGKITSVKPAGAIDGGIKPYKIVDSVSSVSSSEKKLYKSENSKYTVALYDFGSKENIRRELNRLGCDVWVLPCNSTSDEILKLSPDGIMLSNGPGDPADNTGIIKNLKSLLTSSVPIFGICLGHQLLALASGFETNKLKYGHRGANQPVKDTQSGRAYITSQNHGYAVVSKSIDARVADEWFVNVNDGTCEGIAYKNAPAFSVQFHPEACGGPRDTAFLFDKFINSMEAKKNAAR